MRIARLRQDAEQLVIGKKIKPGECSSLCLQVSFQLLLHVIQGIVCPLQALQDPWDVECIHAQLLLLANLPEQILPVFVHLLELGSFLGELTLDILCREDVLQVHPRALYGVPLIYHVCRLVDPLLPQLDLLSNSMNESASHHCCNGHAMVLTQCDDICQVAKNPEILLVSMIHNWQLQVCPSSDDLLQGLFQCKLAARICRDFRDVLAVLENAIALQLCKADAAGRSRTLVSQVDLFEQLLPVPRAKSRISQIQDARHALAPFVDHALYPHSHLITIQRSCQAIGSLVGGHDLLVHSLHIHLDKL
mmetsp:Transcript_13884/g.32983  ORF Transcript_13884/g.32983 Transcript_13884/m.32983 type:complete len:306 (+) Transcript_13884:8851-9768(+)